MLSFMNLPKLSNLIRQANICLHCEVKAMNLWREPIKSNYQQAIIPLLGSILGSMSILKKCAYICILIRSHVEYWCFVDLADCQPSNQQPQICRWYHSNGRKQRGTKEPLDEGERREWKGWLKMAFKKQRSWHPVPSLHGKLIRKKQWQIFFVGGS